MVDQVESSAPAPRSGDTTSRTPSSLADVEAFMFIQTQIGERGAVAQVISSLPGVACVEAVNGAYDVVARVHAPSIEDLGRMVLAPIRETISVTRLVTCPVLRPAKLRPTPAPAR